MMVELEANKHGSSTPSNMDIDDAGVNTAKFAFNVLQLIKTAQGEHGVKHHDYTRYRRYCTARLRRLYKSLKFTHGRNKYIKKQIVIDNITDVRFLHILLYLAERAWSYAMAIKQKADGTTKLCQHFHLVGRLSKAMKWADLFSRACAVKADPRTSLEAMAYALYMKGCYLVEKKVQWDAALKNFKSARAIYEELGKYGSVENHVLCRQRVDDELVPNIRYCLYKLGRSDVSGPELSDLSPNEGPGLDIVQAKLEAVIAEAKSQQAVTMTELEWLGHKFPVANAKTRACILKAQQLEKVLLGPSVSCQRKLGACEKALGAYQEAKRHIREDLVTAGNAEDVKDELNGLDKAVSCILLQRTVDRTQLLVTIMRAKLEKSKQQRNPKEDNNADMSPRFLELARLFGVLVQNLTDLSDLATSGKSRSAEETVFAEQLAAKKIAFQSQRCFFLAQSYCACGKHAEAYLLYIRAREYADAAVHDYQTLPNQDESVTAELRKLSEECRVQGCLVHAMGVVESARVQESVRKGVSSISLTQKNLTKKKAGYLLEALDQYESFVALAGFKDPPRITHIPPALQAVPCKPIVLDTAVSTISFPSLDGRLRKEDKKKSFFKFW